MRPVFLQCGLTLGIITAGCTNSAPRLVPPSIDSAAGAAAIKQYDADGDGGLSGAELDKSPPLKSSMARLDKDQDGRLTAKEIDDRIQQWRQTRVALTSVAPTIRLNGNLLEDAQVTLLPEAFLGEAVEPAIGKTNRQGIARPRISAEPDGAGLRIGFYRVQISKTVNGKEILPARYNTQTEIGLEIATDLFETRNPEFNLVSR